MQDSRIWECNTSLDDIQKFFKMKYQGKLITSTAPSIWLAWAKYNFKQVLEDPKEILNTRIWGNSLLCKENKPMWDKTLTLSNLDKILSIYQPEEKQVLTYDELVACHGPVITFLKYCTV